MEPITEKQFALFSNFVTNHDAFVIVGHKEPDGDCISSSLALGELLKYFKKPVSILNAGPFKLSEIKLFAKNFKTEFTPLTSNPKKTGLFIVDCSEIHRLGDISEQVKDLDSFIIDHHRTSSGNPDASIIDPKAPATAYLIQQIYEHECGTIPENVATTLFLGLCTDTGYFRFLDTSSAPVFRAAARLIEAGANPRKTYDYITSGKPFNTRKLLGLMLDRVEPYFDGRLMITYETMTDTKKYGKEGRDSDMLYSALLSVEGVEAVVFMRQESTTNCTVGLRSRDDIDVSAVAAIFGGGGHKNASGLSTEATLETLKPRIIKEFSNIFD
jgi:phosphoesterase RecJ-like protein